LGETGNYRAIALEYDQIRVWYKYRVEMKKADQRFLDKEQLRKRLSLPSTRGVDELMRTKRIPFLRLGHRTVRFDWPKVEKALARFEVKEAGRMEKAA
jgi:hypothetical protein